MKTLITITSILTLLLIMPGCQKGSNSTVGQYYMNATIGTDSFSATGLSNAYLSSSSSGGINYTYISGKATDGRFIKITLASNPNIPVSAGTIPINFNGTTANYYPKGLDSAYTNAVTGSIILTSIAPNYQGTFNFVCADNTNVTNGTFSVRVQ